MEDRLSIATVKMNVDTGLISDLASKKKKIYLYAPIVRPGFTDYTWRASWFQTVPEIKVVLNGGQAMAEIDGITDEKVSVGGNIEYGDGYFSIHGDGEITISQK